MNQKQIFYIQGMHCNACVLMTEGEIGEMENVVSVKVNLKKEVVEVFGEFGDKTREAIAEELSGVLESRGYRISVEKIVEERKWSDFRWALPIALGVMIIFWFLQKINIVNLISSGEVTYGTAFVIGIVASLSSCMAVVGGLLLSLSATFAKDGDKIRPQVLFHGGRLLAFFLLGGVIGVAGSVFALSSSATFVLSMIVGMVMLLLGINLLDVFPWAKKFQVSMPKFIAQRAHTAVKLNHTATPFLVGIVTFFLPCGFTQSMQLYTLTTGSFLTGAMTMFFFALGTFPVLALVSFSSLSVKESSASGIFFKSAGIIVIAFALFNMINALVAAGIIVPVFNF